MAVSSSSNSKRHTGHLTSLGGSADQESCYRPYLPAPTPEGHSCPNLTWKTEGLDQSSLGEGGSGKPAPNTSKN